MLRDLDNLTLGRVRTSTLLDTNEFPIDDQVVTKRRRILARVFKRN